MKKKIGSDKLNPLNENSLASTLPPLTLNISIALLIILIISVFSYLPIFHCGFVNWDETKYIQNNSLIRTINLKDIFSNYQMGNYHPITMLVYAIEYHFWQLNETGYHIVNLSFHLLNALLVFYSVLLLRGKTEIAILTALLFGIHPLHVESVAWVAELKDLLYTFFFLASFSLYLIYRRTASMFHYFLSIFLFLLSLLSKAMAVSLPVVLILADYFMGRKINMKSLLEKLPFFLLSLIFGVVAIAAQNSKDAIQGFIEFSFFQHVIFACYSFIIYISKLIIPINLCAYYPYPEGGTSIIPMHYYFYAPLLLLILFLVKYSIRFNKIIFFGFTLFATTIFLVLQLLPVGDAIMAERYSYIPSIGILFLLAEGIYWLWSNKYKIPGIVLLTGFTIFFSLQTFSRCNTWKDGVTLWSDVIEKYPNVYLAYGNRGGAYSNESKHAEALADFNKAIELSPKYYLLYLNRGILFNNQNKIKDAFADFNKAIELNPNVAEIYNYRGIIYLNEKNFENAINDYNTCIRLNPDFADAYNNRGYLYMNQKNTAAALENFNSAIKLNPFFPEAYNNRGLLFTSLNRLDEAVNDYSKAIELNPLYGSAYINRGNQLMNENKYDDALADYNNAIKLQPNYPKAYNNRGTVYMIQNKFPEALNDFNKSIELQPDNSQAYFSRGLLLIKVKNFAEAISDFSKSLDLNNENAMAYFQRGIAEYYLNRKDSACIDIKEAAKRGIQQAEAVFNKFCK